MGAADVNPCNEPLALMPCRLGSMQSDHVKNPSSGMAESIDAVLKAGKAIDGLLKVEGHRSVFSESATYQMEKKKAVQVK